MCGGTPALGDFDGGELPMSGLMFHRAPKHRPPPHGCGEAN